jgi:hypothetical protein
MLRKHLRRSLEPNPRILSDDICDDSRYEVLRPGVMLSGINGELCHTCAGVLVEKGDQVRLTVAEHGFAPATPSAYHAKMTDKAIGDVCDRFQDTEIGLLHLQDTVAFENNPYFQVVTPLTKLLHSSKLRGRQVFGVDTFVTGYQELRSIGVRAVHRSRTVVRARDDPPYCSER